MEVLTDTWSAWWNPGWNTTWACTDEANAREPRLTKKDVANVLRRRFDRVFRNIPPEWVMSQGDVGAYGGLSAERSVGRWPDRQSPEVTVENQSGASLHSAQGLASTGKGRR